MRASWNARHAAWRGCSIGLSMWSNLRSAQNVQRYPMSILTKIFSFTKPRESKMSFTFRKTQDQSTYRHGAAQTFKARAQERAILARYRPEVPVDANWRVLYVLVIGSDSHSGEHNEAAYLLRPTPPLLLWRRKVYVCRVDRETHASVIT
jgi:hypothetical protein